MSATSSSGSAFLIASNGSESLALASAHRVPPIAHGGVAAQLLLDDACDGCLCGVPSTPVAYPVLSELGRDAGLDVVMDRCLKIEHARFAGGLNLAGFNTGVITSRRRR